MPCALMASSSGAELMINAARYWKVDTSQTTSTKTSLVNSATPSTTERDASVNLRRNLPRVAGNGSRTAFRLESEMCYQLLI